MPQSIIRNGRYDGDWLFADGVDKFRLSAVERDAAIGVAARGSVLQVTLDGKPDVRELAAYLMMPTCEELYFKQRVALSGADHLIMQACLFCLLQGVALPICWAFVIGVRPILLLITHQPMCE